jgi:hypothetical protein
MATFSDDIAATTAASARQTTAVTAPGRMLDATGSFTAGVAIVVISCSRLTYDVLE